MSYFCPLVDKSWVILTAWMWARLVNMDFTCLIMLLYMEKNWERSRSRLYTVTLLIWLICRVHHAKCQDGWITSWNQDLWQKYNKLKIYRRYHSNGRKWRWTKKPLDEGKREEWKNRLKTQHSKNKDRGILSHHLMAKRWGNSGNSDRFYFLVLQNYCGWWLQP